MDKVGDSMIDSHTNMVYLINGLFYNNELEMLPDQEKLAGAQFPYTDLVDPNWVSFDKENDRYTFYNVDKTLIVEKMLRYSQQNDKFYILKYEYYSNGMVLEHRVSYVKGEKTMDIKLYHHFQKNVKYEVRQQKNLRLSKYFDLFSEAIVYQKEEFLEESRVVKVIETDYKVMKKWELTVQRDTGLIEKRIEVPFDSQTIVEKLLETSNNVQKKLSNNVMQQFSECFDVIAKDIYRPKMITIKLPEDQSIQVPKYTLFNLTPIQMKEMKVKFTTKIADFLPVDGLTMGNSNQNVDVEASFSSEDVVSFGTAKLKEVLTKMV
jgi:hypothetical protein